MSGVKRKCKALSCSRPAEYIVYEVYRQSVVIEHGDTYITSLCGSCWLAGRGYGRGHAALFNVRILEQKNISGAGSGWSPRRMPELLEVKA